MSLRRREACNAFDCQPLRRSSRACLTRLEGKPRLSPRREHPRTREETARWNSLARSTRAVSFWARAAHESRAAWRGRRRPCAGGAMTDSKGYDRRAFKLSVMAPPRRARWWPGTTHAWRALRSCPRVDREGVTASGCPERNSPATPDAALAPGPVRRYRGHLDWAEKDGSRAPTRTRSRNGLLSCVFWLFTTSKAAWARPRPR